MMTASQHENLLEKCDSPHLAYERLLCKHQGALAMIQALAEVYQMYGSVDFPNFDVAAQLRDLLKNLAKDGV